MPARRRKPPPRDRASPGPAFGSRGARSDTARESAGVTRPSTNSSLWAGTSRPVTGDGAWEASLPEGANPRPDERGWGGKPPWRRGRTGAVPGESAEIRRPIAGSHPCPTSRHEPREFPRPFSCDAALDPRSSCSGRFRQGLDQRRQGPMSLDPAELALGAQEARRAPPPPHLPVTPPRHAGCHPPRHREGRLDGMGRFQAVPPSSSREEPRPVERPDERNRPLHFSASISEA